jgi:rhodanese-related sulfurtransferase
MKRMLFAVAALLILVVIIGTSYAEWPAELSSKIDQLKADAEAKKDMPAALPGIRNVTTEEVKKLIDSKKAIPLDNRVKVQYETEKIPGSVWFLADDLVKNPSMADKLDKTKEYIMYCNGIHCWRSPATALMLQHLGFSKILWYREGIPDWKKKGFALD